MFNPVLPVGPQIIKPDTVPFLIHNPIQGMFKLCKLGGIDKTFEDGICTRCP